MATNSKSVRIYLDKKEARKIYEELSNRAMFYQSSKIPDEDFEARREARLRAELLAEIAEHFRV